MKKKLLSFALFAAFFSLTLIAAPKLDPNDMSFTAEEQAFYDKLSAKPKECFKMMKHRQRAMAMQLAEKSTPDKGVEVLIKMNNPQKIVLPQASHQ